MASSAQEVPPERLLHIYRTMVRVRSFDEKLTELSKQGEPIIHHPSLGQEAPAVAACAALEPADVIMPYHRGWAWAMGKGMEPGRILAELLGKRTGYGKGKSGPHLADWDLGVLGRSGTQGAHLQIAAGVGHALRLEGKGRVCLAFFGEGASNTGAFHEGVNIAAIWNAPVVYVCESNGYQSVTPAHEIMRVSSVAERAAGYGIAGVTVDGNDAISIYETVGQAIQRARQGLGPSLVDCRTYLLGDNYYVQGVPVTPRRSSEEIEGWRQKCPVRRLRDQMLDTGLLTEAGSQRIEADALAEVEAAVHFAYDSPYCTRQDVVEDVYAT